MTAEAPLSEERIQALQDFRSDLTDMSLETPEALKDMLCEAMVKFWRDIDATVFE